MPRRRPYQRLYVQVLAAIAVGAALGSIDPARAVALQPLGDGFIRLVRMLIAPIVFSTVVVGITQMGAMKDLGRIGARALLYFEAVTTLALTIGLAVAATLQPVGGMSIDPKSVEVSAIAAYTSPSKQMHVGEFLLNIIPTTVGDAFAKGEILQVLLFSILFGLALLRLGERARPLVDMVQQLSSALFAMVDLIMRFAPIGAFGAMAFTVGRFGVGALLSLGKLMGSVYLTCVVFVAVVLGTIARATGFSLWKLLVYIREEILVVLATSSSESVLPQLMDKLETAGCPKSVVGLVVPTGYSFNLDGTSIYMTMAVMFIAQAMNVPLTFGQEASILAVLLLTSKGAAAVTGGGFITLAATLAATPAIPIAGLALLLGVDRFMSEARAITNLIGNAVATIAVARWEGVLDRRRLATALARGRAADAEPAFAGVVSPVGTPDV
jgi:aerobic C4-dicarboxylate transport protein